MANELFMPNLAQTFISGQQAGTAAKQNALANQWAIEDRQKQNLLAQSQQKSAAEQADYQYAYAATENALRSQDPYSTVMGMAKIDPKVQTFFTNSGVDINNKDQVLMALQNVNSWAASKLGKTQAAPEIKAFKQDENVYQFDPRTGQPTPVITGKPKQTLERKTRQIGDMNQDYNFNPATGEETPVGSPYRGRPTAQESRAPAYRDIIDPKNPKQLITIDGNVYRGGSIGDQGVIGIAGKEPSAAKADETRGTGKEAVSTQIANLRDIYTQLNEGGGIVNTDNSSNLGAAFGSSALGQKIGGAVGTKNQSLRNQVSQARPLLLQAIKQATGMSAKQMDSNAEMKMYLAAATDPTLDFQANMKALDNLEKLFGAGVQSSPSASQPIRVNTPQEAMSLPKGTIFITPDGRQKVR